MNKFEVLDHKADLKIRVWGKTKEGLFLNALLAMEECIKPEVKKPEEKVKRKIKIKSLDLPSLLVDFLSEALYLIQTNKEAYNDVKFAEFSHTEVKAELLGKKAESFGEDIKAATHHDLQARQLNDGTWEATIIFDV